MRRNIHAFLTDFQHDLQKIMTGRPRIGRPSEWIFPIFSSLAAKASASSNPGSRIRLCTFLVFRLFIDWN